MPTRKKVKGKTKATRRKAPVATATIRRKSATVGKKPAKKKKASLQPVSLTKAKPKASTSVKPTPVSPPAQPVAAKPTTRPTQPALPEERIGVVSHYYSHPSVATLRLESGTLRIDDVIHIRGHTTDLRQRVESLEVNHAPVTEVGPNDDFGLKVVGHVREHDVVYKVRR